MQRRALIAALSAPAPARAQAGPRLVAPFGGHKLDSFTRPEGRIGHDPRDLA